MQDDNLHQISKKKRIFLIKINIPSTCIRSWDTVHAMQVV